MRPARPRLTEPVSPTQDREPIQRETGNRNVSCGSASGRAVIAMTAVRIGAHVEPGKVTDLSDIRPPTDVMAITSLPHARANHPVSGSPLSAIHPRHLPPRAATRHPKRDFAALS